MDFGEPLPDNPDVRDEEEDLRNQCHDIVFGDDEVSDNSSEPPYDSTSEPESDPEGDAKEDECKTREQKAKAVKRYARKLLDLTVTANCDNKVLESCCGIFLGLLADLGVLASEQLDGITIPKTYYMLNKWAERDEDTSKLVPICSFKNEDHHVFLDDDESLCPVCGSLRPSDAIPHRCSHL